MSSSNDLAASVPAAQPGSGVRNPRTSVRMVPLEFGSLILLVALAVTMTAAMLELQTSATAYIIGESHWSKAQQEVAQALQRYASSGDPAQFARVQETLRIPLGDRSARLALEQDPADIEAARRGFIEGMNSPQDVGRMIRMYRYFHNAPFFRESVEKWRIGDAGVLELKRLGDEIQSVHARGGMNAELALSFQQQVLDVDARLRPVETAFSQSLVDGTRILKTVLIVASIVLFLAIAWIVLLVLRSTLARIRASEGTFRAAFHQAAVGMLKMSSDGRILEANEAICIVLGYSSAQIRQKRIADLLHPDDRSAIVAEGFALDWSVLEIPCEHRFVCEDGATRWVRWTASRIEGDPGDRERVFAIIEDISDSRRLADEMKYQASHDALTGLVNRREIEQRLRRGIDSAHRCQREHAFLFVDLDQFKLINDTCGHVAGDQLLRQIAGVLMLHMRGNDWMGRLGGDEFAVLLENTGIEEALRIAERLRRALSASTFPWEGRRFNVTCSIGIARVSAGPMEVGDVLRAADRACYQAKEDGRNCIRVYHESDQAMGRRRDDLAWVAEIRQAIVDGRIVLYAQRIEVLSGREELRYEVLVRLIDASGAVCTPESFLPAAERFGEAISLDRLVISMALRQLEDHPEHLRMLDLCHLNVSAQSIASPDFRHHVVSLLDSSRVPAAKLCFELTETAAIGNIIRAREFIDEMRARGCRIALDDFGSGMSSFAYLKNLAVDVLKIDGIFVRDLANNEVDPVLVKSMCEVARSLGKTTVAESVEDRALLKRLRELGVEQAQGYAIHEPCALSELIDASAIVKAPRSH